ncbi:hypothetical protein B0H13DRAFT_2054191 [Mycena leptocephala]|nr:hypothetical protein B0H13DRAFT_2067057 [Mycena leptocephala]KAJ7877171.1 hypothetical protein B0H13DRAFT_2054191 [Mycena leptocephala]
MAESSRCPLSYPLMALKLVLVLAAVAFAGAMPMYIYDAQFAFDMPVFTVTREYKTITDVPPYIVTRTTTMTWTQSSSTVIPFPTGPGTEH